MSRSAFALNDTRFSTPHNGNEMHYENIDSVTTTFEEEVFYGVGGEYDDDGGENQGEQED